MSFSSKEYQLFIETFRRKLRSATDGYSSISELCREAGINRQQFNKYLAGDSLPSLYNLHRICGKLGIKIDDLLGNADQRDASLSEFHRRSNLVERQSRQELARGWYLEISRSDVMNDHILVSLCKVSKMKDGGNKYRRIMPAQWARTEKRKFYQYAGLVAKSSNTIDIRYLNLFAVNYNSINIGHYKLIPISLSGPDMIGIKMAVDSKLPWRGMPFSSGVYFKYLGQYLRLSDARKYLRTFPIGEEPDYIRAPFETLQLAFTSQGDCISM